MMINEQTLSGTNWKQSAKEADINASRGEHGVREVHDQKWKDLHIIAAGDLFGAMAGSEVNAVNAAQEVKKLSREEAQETAETVME
jgi:hypothetical protein